MIDPALLIAFLVAATILTITPGVDTAMVLRAAAIDGKRPAVMAGLGICLGCLVWGAAVSLGLGAVLRASELAYTIIKFAGATYLLWLGAKLIFAPRSKIGDNSVAKLGTGRDAFWRGLLTNLLNPKVGVFYVTFLPQFVPAGANVAIASFALACLHVLLGLAWFAMLITATAPLSAALRQPATVKWLDRLTGGIFMAFGIKLATSSLR